MKISNVYIACISGTFARDTTTIFPCLWNRDFLHIHNAVLIHYFNFDLKLIITRRNNYSCYPKVDLKQNFVLKMNMLWCTWYGLMNNNISRPAFTKIVKLRTSHKIYAINRNVIWKRIKTEPKMMLFIEKVCYKHT